MTSAVVPLSEIDRRIAEAHCELGVVRSAFARSPSGAAAVACEAAEARVNELLDARLDRMSAVRRARAA
jgi:hypothetical protein